MGGANKTSGKRYTEKHDLDYIGMAVYAICRKICVLAL